MAGERIQDPHERSRSNFQLAARRAGDRAMDFIATEHYETRDEAIRHYQYVLPMPYQLMIYEVDRMIANGSITVGTKKS